MVDLINEKDSLNTGRKKLNKAIKDANTAKNTAEQADNKATEALANSESTQEQLNQVVIDGDSSVEAAQARVDYNGNTHQTLKARLDYEYSEKASIFTQATEPSVASENSYWYEDLGKAPITIEVDSLLVANAQTRTDEPDDTEDLWFRVGGNND